MRAKNALANARRGAAIERDRFERGQTLDQRDEIVALVLADIAVKTALAARLRHDVPQAHPSRTQRLQARIVLHRNEILADHLAHQMPELVLLVRVVLLMRE